MVPEVRRIDRKKCTLIVASGGAVLVIGAAGAFTLMAVKDQTYVPSAPYEPQGELKDVPSGDDSVRRMNMWGVCRGARFSDAIGALP